MNVLQAAPLDRTRTWSVKKIVRHVDWSGASGFYIHDLLSGTRGGQRQKFDPCKQSPYEYVNAIVV